MWRQYTRLLEKYPWRTQIIQSGYYFKPDNGGGGEVEFLKLAYYSNDLNMAVTFYETSGYAPRGL